MIKGRFAPSPTGRMHLGNVYAALLSWLSAKSKGGEWVLRIEDIDPARSKQEYADSIMDDLEWLGLTWDDEVTYQSKRQDIYEHYFDLLDKEGLLYPCFCTREDLLATQAPHESDGRVVYKGTCRNMTPANYPQGITPAWRIRVPDRTIETADGHYGTYQTNLTTEIGDFIVSLKSADNFSSVRFSPCLRRFCLILGLESLDMTCMQTPSPYPIRSRGFDLSSHEDC